MHRFTRSKFLSIAPREVTWQQRKAILAYTQAHLGVDSLLSLKRGSSDESKDKLFTMSAAFVLARYGMLQLLAQEVLANRAADDPHREGVHRWKHPPSDGPERTVV